MSPTLNERVTPRDHDPGCRRGTDPALPHYALDRERCERCRNLWTAISEQHEQTMAILRRRGA